MTFAWTFNRLRAMTPAEVVHRVGEKSRKLVAKRASGDWSRFRADGPAPNLPAIRAHVETFDGRRRESAAGAALDALAGRFSALGREWPRRRREDLFPADFWRLDPVTGKLWPGAEAYCFDIPYRRVRERGDVKYVWEINRLQFLQPLAAHALLGGHAPALPAIEAAIASWRAANPPFRGLGWSSGVEVALRAISLLIVSSLVGDRLAAPCVDQIRAILAASLSWLTRYPSLHSSANNHRIAEAAAQCLIALAMPDLPHATELRLRARRILDAEATAQFHGDGVPAEQSPTYGAFSAELLLLCHANAPLAATARARLDQFADFVFRLADEGGRIPSIGDDDEGRVLNFAPARETYAFDVACRIKAPPSPKALHIFREGGLSVIRHGRWRLLLDHGPLGYLAIAAHGHADALSICASLDDQPLLVDPGTYLYHSGGEARDWFRSTRAHNTLNIEGENQSVIAGPFNWSRKAECRLDEAREGPGWRIAASHDGYQKRFGLRHRRMIAAQGGGFRIEDRLLGGARQAEIVFQLASDLIAEVDGEICRVFRGGRRAAQIRFDPRGAVAVSWGRVSPAFGVKRAAQRIVWTGRVDEVGVRAVIQPI